jgi:hypothetical protein
LAKKILNVATLGLIGGSVLKPFGGSKKKAPAPAPETPVMPMADDEAVRRARRAALARQMSRGGRSSTILSSGSETLGGGYG